jgi:hypothetical protein
MNFYLVIAFSFSILIPGITAVVRFGKVERRYYPFFYCLWLGCLNEALSLWLTLHHRQTLINSNVYVLLESLLLTWFFRRTGVLKSKKQLIITVTMLSVFWVAENFVISNVRENSTYFRIFASLLISGLSILLVTEIIFDIKVNLLKNPEFILCCCFITYFSFKALDQAFVIYGLTRDTNFLIKVYNIMLYINLGVNLLYIPAILWMPRKVPFTFRSS